MSLHVQPVNTQVDLDRLVPEWETLAAGITPWTPFTTPAWNLAHWAHFQRSRFTVRDRLQSYAVRDDRGRLVAVAPMQMTLRPGLGPIKFRQLHYFGADPNITEIRGLICRPEDEHAAAAALSDTLRETRWDLLHSSGLHHGGPAYLDLTRAAVPTAERMLSDFYIELPDSFDALRARLSRNAKQALRKCYNSLKQDGHVFTLDIITRPQDCDAALTLFFELHKARAQADYGISHPDVFADQVGQNFLRDYVRGSAERGELRLFQLRIAQTVVATRIGFCVGDDLYLYYSGHLPEWGGYSVMTTTVTEALKWAIAAGLTRVNLSTGSDKSKLRWQPTEIRLAEWIQAAPSWRGEVMTRMFRRQKRTQSANAAAAWNNPMVEPVTGAPAPVAAQDGVRSAPAIGQNPAVTAGRF